MTVWAELYVAVTLGALVAAPGSAPVICDRVIDDFSSTPDGSFPRGWRAKYEHNQQEAESRYVVEEVAGARALHARYRDHTITIVRRLPAWSLDDYPYLQWRWRATTLPHGGDESRRATNDSAAAVYLVWDAWWPFRARTLKLAWSTTLPVGTRVTRRLNHDGILVLASGLGDGSWRRERINVREVHDRVFGGSASTPLGIALTTDADDTNSSAEAWYARFELCRPVR